MKANLFAATLITVLTVALAASAQPIVIDLPFSAYDLSEDGMIVAGSSYEDDNFYWTEAEGIVPTPGGFASTVTANPFIMAGRDDAYDSAYWTPDAGWTTLGAFPGAGACGPVNSVWDMSTNGQFIAGHGYHNDGASCSLDGYVYEIATGTFTRLVGLGDGSAVVKSVSNDGTVAAGWERIPGGLDRTPIAWIDGVAMHLTPGEGGEATKVSADGSTVVGYTYSSAFVWTQEGGLELIGRLPNFWDSAHPTDLSDDGSVVVGGSFLGGSGGLFEGWVWTAETGMVDIITYMLDAGVTQANAWAPQSEDDYVGEYFEAISGDAATFLVKQTFGGATLIELDIAGPCCTGDLNDDCTVGFPDLTTLLASWGQDGVADLNGDSIVGFPDLTTLLAAWGPC